MKLLEPDLLSTQTINECPRRSAEPGLAHSKGKPDVLTTTTNISVRFAPLFVMEIQIRVLKERYAERPNRAGVASLWVGNVYAAAFVE